MSAWLTVSEDIWDGVKIISYTARARLAVIALSQNSIKWTHSEKGGSMYHSVNSANIWLL